MLETPAGFIWRDKLPSHFSRPDLDAGEPDDLIWAGITELRYGEMEGTALVRVHAHGRTSIGHAHISVVIEEGKPSWEIVHVLLSAASVPYGLDAVEHWLVSAGYSPEA